MNKLTLKFERRKKCIITLCDNIKWYKIVLRKKKKKIYLLTQQKLTKVWYFNEILYINLIWVQFVVESMFQSSMT